MNDKQILDWLQDNPQRLQDTYWRIENENCSIRDAVEWLAKAEQDE